MPTPPDAHDAMAFYMWALVIVCGGLATLAGASLRWAISHLESKEKECKLERKEDQGEFLKALAARDAHMSALTAEVQKTNKLVEDHHKAMTIKHEMEVEKIATLAGAAAIERYKHDNPANRGQ